MEQQTTQTARLMGERSRRRRWQRVVGVLAALVVFCTTYALILPAITMTGAPICGIEEHTHTEACYTVREAQPRLVCTAAQTVHVHTDACRGSDGEWICGQADFLLHTHEESCYDADGSLIWAHKISIALVNPMLLSCDRKGGRHIFASTMDGVVVRLDY